MASGDRHDWQHIFAALYHYGSVSAVAHAVRDWSRRGFLRGALRPSIVPAGRVALLDGLAAGTPAHHAAFETAIQITRARRN